MNNNPVRKIFFLTLALGALVLFSSQVQAQDNQPPTQGEAAQDGQNRPLPELGQLLNLTPEQLRQLFAINKRTAPEFQRARQRMKIARDDLDDAIYADVPDEALIATKVQEFNQAQSELERMRTMREFRIRQLLTPDQLNTLRDIRMKAKDRLNRQGLPKEGNDGVRPNGRRNLQPGNNSVPPGNNFRPQPQQKGATPVKKP